ncbi:protein of unknown function [Methylocaldum szegediense]|uniref:Uncharacterized protein n=1 Tax=Methylocaldum szegediense TaxID=73780 RepID=A0ABM9I9C9_9GAMM|nr:protein of unknown function [Methylocaldum szegediense]
MSLIKAFHSHEPQPRILAVAAGECVMMVSIVNSSGTALSKYIYMESVSVGVINYGYVTDRNFERRPLV